jgi:hypothetical protein
MGKSVVSVEFEVWGGFGPFRREGYDIVALERLAIPRSGRMGKRGFK